MAVHKYHDRRFKKSSGLWLYKELAQTPVEDTALAAVRARTIDTDPVYVYFTSGSTGIPKGVARL